MCRAVLILVVEDDRLINLMATDELQRAGFDVISVYSADEAIEILESRNDIRFLFTDIDMPGSLNGLRLAALVRAKWPPISIIITSGMNAPDSIPDQAIFMRKPYRTAQVLDAISTLM
jgi:CheY-like chemotaxis protein